LFEKLEWSRIDISEIDWTKDQVFAHLRDPLVRHRKGIVEGICNYFPQEIRALFLRDSTAVQFLSHVTIVESHSYTIEKWLGRKNSTLVHWIPIDTSIDHVTKTLDLIESLGAPVDQKIKTWFTNLPMQNKSTPEELLLYESLIKYDTPGEILRYIDFDRCLYELTTTYYGFEPNNYRERVDQLRSQNLTEMQAQEQADREVESGEYLSWSTRRTN
jgi:hypothetical protein